MQWFAADNPSFPGHKDANRVTGCLGPTGQFVQNIDDVGFEPDTDYCKNHLNDRRCQRGCYTHPTLVDVLNGAGINWKYYAQKPADLWAAPTAMTNICVPSPQMPGSGITCLGTDWHNNLEAVLPNSNQYQNEQAPILKDIESCNLPQVSWVIPDGHWSDHPGHTVGRTDSYDGGPSWVQHIVNAVGNSWEQSKVNNQNHQCDYWGSNVALNDSRNQATVVLVVWDDWGGWFDHVAPFSIGYPGGNGNGQYYTYGFRVPLLVVSAFTKQVTPQGGYISGPATGYTCTNTNYCHDFGSILNFIEYTFGSGGSLPRIGDDNYPYADKFAPDGPDECTSCVYSLSDFFNFDANPHGFTAITGAKYEEKCFHQPNQTGCFPGFTPADPDNDAEEAD